MLIPLPLLNSCRVNTLSGKHVLLGITGGIAAYKSAELVRLLRARDAEVRVIMTPGAQAFITPLTLQALSGHPVHTELLDFESEQAMNHITLARWADVLLIAPATADCLSRLVQGRADDLLGAVTLACTAPLAVAPAMNRAMWENPATQANLAALRARGLAVYGPGEGEQACGETGPGRMLEPAALVHALSGLFQPGSLSGLRVLVTAGPTREAIDPVRYISNHSSGRMGFAVARAAVEAGALVTLISGPVSLPTPERVTRIDVTSAQQMLAAVEAHVAACDIFISVAAVADYRPVSVQPEKLKKNQELLSLTLTRNPDILAAVAGREHAPFCVGFAAETEQLEAHARAKLTDKGLDMIAANLVGGDTGFDSLDNELLVLWAGGNAQLARAGKGQLAQRLVSLVATRYHASSNRVIHFDAKDSA